jgi:methylphosphotriester-DNA--protein-cysteine methyltransferase
VNGLHRLPAPDLAPFIASFWEYRAAAQPHRFESLLPDATATLIVDLAESRVRVHRADDVARFDDFDSALVCGPHGRCFAIPTDRPSHVLGISFRPAGASALLGLPATEIFDRHVGLTDLWGIGARSWCDQVSAGRTAAERLEIVERALRARSRPVDLRPRHPAVLHALRAFGAGSPRPPSVARVVEEIGISQRRFIELFRRDVGMAPKHYCRVRRFRNTAIAAWTAHRSAAAAAAAGAPASFDWSSFALDHGYADQSHLVREFRDHCGLTPTAFAAHGGHHAQHAPIF